MNTVDRTFAPARRGKPTAEPQSAPSAPPEGAEDDVTLMSDEALEREAEQLAQPPAPAEPPIDPLTEAVRRVLDEQNASMLAKVQQARALVELDAITNFQCLKCDRVPGRPAYCASCTRQARRDPNPRVRTALLSRPPGVPMPAWHAAVGCILRLRSRTADGAEIALLLDRHTALIRNAVSGAFGALKG